MPRYRFNIIDGHKIFDPNGRNLVNDDAAEAEAENLAHGLGRSPLSKHWKAIEVLDEKGKKIYKAPVPRKDDEHE